MAATLRPGNAHTAEGAREFVVNTVRNIARHTDGTPRLVRMAAGFSGNDALERLEHRGINGLRKTPDATLEKTSARGRTRTGMGHCPEGF